MTSETTAVVVVTGANGFIGSHICKLLLEKGYTVHATVRNADDEKNHFLTTMAESHPGSLKLFTAPLEEPGVFDEPLQDADYVIHTAAVVKFASKDAQKEIIDVPKAGLLNLLGSCSKIRKEKQKLKCFVQMSSIAAICDKTKPQEYVFTEDNWNDSATLKTSPYDTAKTAAERALEEYVKGLPEEEKFRVVVINPSLVLGPALARYQGKQSSLQLILDMVIGTMSRPPAFHFPTVHIDDVALMHVKAMETESLSGRYICSSGESKWMIDLAKSIRSQFPHLKKPSTSQIPNFVLYFFALFDKRLSFGVLKATLSRTLFVSNERATSEMQMEWKDTDTGIKDTIQSFIDHGLIPKE